MDATTAQLLADARRKLDNYHETLNDFVTDTSIAIANLIAVVERQDARIAALEAARAPQGEKQP